jgi:hypothetical protein
MALSAGRCALGVVAVVLLGTSSAWSHDAVSSPSDYAGSSASRAKQLVEEALQAGLAGDEAKRKQLLSEAVAADGELELARWLSGQVKFNGMWQSPEAVGELVNSHPRWQQYKEMRNESGGTLADHVALARWCMKNGLAAEERFHWMVVVLQDPSHKQARQRLSLRQFRGGLFTEKQIAEYEQLEKQAAANMRKYKPKFVELVRQARGESKAVREGALAKIRAIDDVGAIAPLQEVIGRSRRDSSDPKTQDINLALVTALGNMREHEATLTLLNYALFSASEEVRSLAAEALKPRSTTDYVPLLMGAMTAPIEAEFDVVAAPDGTVRMIQTFHQSGPEADASHTQFTNFEVEGAFGRDRTKTDPRAVLRNHLSRAEAEAEEALAEVESYNADAAERNSRIQAVLKNTLGLDLGDDPEKYWSAWKADNEIYYEEEPSYDTYDEESYTYYYEQAPQYAVSTGAPARPTAPTLSLSSLPAHPECFAPGTLVWTQEGPRPIEEVTIGDMVLAQNPTTGELAYRPVLDTTVGDPVPVLKLTFSGETITSTLGHRFWVNGRGWQMAKHLKPAMALHALDQGVDVAAIEKGEDIPCYNLVVDEFHTFFVGKSRLLVHDKSCPAPTTAAIPGYVQESRTSVALK